MKEENGILIPDFKGITYEKQKKAYDIINSIADLIKEEDKYNPLENAKAIRNFCYEYAKKNDIDPVEFESAEFKILSKFNSDIILMGEALNNLFVLYGFITDIEAPSTNKINQAIESIPYSKFYYDLMKGKYKEKLK
jgi:hypothetical protein